MAGSTLEICGCGKTRRKNSTEFSGMDRPLISNWPTPLVGVDNMEGVPGDGRRKISSKLHQISGVRQSRPLQFESLATLKIRRTARYSQCCRRRGCQSYGN